MQVDFAILVVESTFLKVEVYENDAWDWATEVHHFDCVVSELHYKLLCVEVICFKDAQDYNASYPDEQVVELGSWFGLLHWACQRGDHIMDKTDLNENREYEKESTNGQVGVGQRVHGLELRLCTCAKVHCLSKEHFCIAWADDTSSWKHPHQDWQADGEQANELCGMRL